jgi:di/tricarboxylate transporter
MSVVLFGVGLQLSKRNTRIAKWSIKLFDGVAWILFFLTYLFFSPPKKEKQARCRECAT